MTIYLHQIHANLPHVGHTARAKLLKAMRCVRAQKDILAHHHHVDLNVLSAVTVHRIKHAKMNCVSILVQELVELKRDAMLSIIVRFVVVHQTILEILLFVVIKKIVRKYFSKNY